MGIHFLSFEQQCIAGQREVMFIESVGKKETLNERFESVRVLRIMGPVGTEVVGAALVSAPAPAPAAMTLAV